MDPVSEVFDKWAKNGRDKLMEKEHEKNVITFLKTASFEKSFTFLDIGCGNGWVIRRIAENNYCKNAIGIDKSKNMILQANSNKGNVKEKYIHTDIESLKHKGKFDFIFSMESLYYVNSIDVVLKKIYKLLKPGGEFFCGTDFYTDNIATIKWANMMKIQMIYIQKKSGKKNSSMQDLKQKQNK